MSQYRVYFSNEDKEIVVHSGKTVLEAAVEAGIILNNSCGGAGTCGKCTVAIEPDGVEVLACEYVIDKDIVVLVPMVQQLIQDRKKTGQQDIEVELDPSVCKLFVRPDLFATGSLTEALKSKYPASDISFSQLSDKSISQDNAEGITIVYRKDCVLGGQVLDEPRIEILGVEGGDTTDILYGVAVDIGTTTVVAKLFDLHEGICHATASSANPQISRGDDVISRINYASNEDGLKSLQEIIVGCLNSLIDEICLDIGISTDSIYEICVAGNTTMNHLFLGLPVKQLGEAPYQAYSLEAHDLSAAELGLKINRIANVHTIENIAGFVGADTTAASLASGMDEAEKVTLLIDIGTNGELVLGSSGKLYAASCAAGPAMEGARISQGSRAVAGAIEGVAVVDGDIELEVIGGGIGTCICGSGLIDVMAVLLELGVVDGTGRFVEADELAGKVSDKILARLTVKDNQPAFVIAFNDDNENEPVLFTQKDVRETQLAKAAIRAGIIFLQKKVGVEDSQIDKVLLAGAFGNYIDRKCALRIGLLPDVPIDKVHFVGNAAGTGCQMVLLSAQHRIEAAKIVKQIDYIEIANEMEFQMVFADALLFE